MKKNKKEEQKTAEVNNKNNKALLIVVAIITIVIVVAVIIYFATGNKILTCTQTMNESQLRMDAEAKIKFSMNRADKVDVSFNVELDEKYLTYKDAFITEFKKQYSTYEKQYNIKPKYEETDKGLKMSFSASNNNFQKIMSISSNKNSYSEVKKDMEAAGYTCK